MSYSAHQKLWKVRYYDNLYRIQEATKLGHNEDEVRKSIKYSYPEIEIISITL